MLTNNVAAGVVAALLAFPVLGPACAWAQTSGPEDQDSSRAIHVEPITLDGQSDTAVVQIPAPAGVTPTTFRATIQIPMVMESGEIEVSSEGTVLRRIALNGDDDTLDLEIPLDEAKASNGYITLQFRTSLRAERETCPDWTTATLDIDDTRVDYDGEPARPQNIADFTTSYLEKLEIYLPDSPSTAEAQAAARLATIGVARFGQEHLEIDVISESAPKPAASTPFIRRAVTREDENSGVRLLDDDVPTMEVTGAGEALSQQVDLVQSNLWNVVVGDQASIAGLEVTPVAPMESATLDELKIGGLSANGQGTVGMDLGIDLTAMSRDASDLTVELHGIHSPVPNSEGAMLTASVGDQVVDAWPADSSGTLDRSVTIPAADVARFTTLHLSLRNSGGGAICGQTQPIELTVAGDSRVRPGQPNSPAMKGFQSTPQVLMPEFLVSTTYNTLESTKRAIRLLTSFQAVSANALRPRWVTLDEARSSTEPALIINSREHPAGLNLPLELTGGRTLQLLGGSGSEHRTVHFDSDFDFAAVQIAESGGRTLVVASSSSGEGELDRTLDWIEGEKDRFGTLDGNVLFTAEGRAPVDLDTADGTVETAAENSESGALPVLAGAGGATVVVLLGVGAWWLIKRRRASSDSSET